jgi:PGF-pre-PGF domain-containing protein
VSISFDSKKTAGKTTTIVETLKGKSTLVSGLPSGEIYKSLNIWVGNSGFATADNIENAVVCFKVEKSWMQNKNIAKSSVVLNKYNNGKWEQLPVNLIGEDDGFIYFTSKTTGFSSFVITGKTEMDEAVVNNSQVNKSQENKSQENKSQVNNPQSTSQPALQSGLDTGNLSGKDNGPAIGSKVEETLKKRADIKSPGFETVYGVISLIALFLYKKK